MPRRRVAAKREIIPDPKFGSARLAKFINHVMESGKKSVAERIVYGALDIVAEKSKEEPIEMFEKALENIQPMVEVIPSRGWCYLPGACRSTAFPSERAGYALARRILTEAW